MSRLRPAARVITTIVVGALLLGSGGLAPIVLGQTSPDRSEVVLVLDFSASILRDAANRNRFGAALERIADRVDQTSSDLTAGDATVTIVQFATRAADYKGCADLKLLDSPRSVGRFASCLRSVARAYRKGLDPTLTRKIGIDTNYVAAMEQAAKHLPGDAARPAVILFTDGKHDVRGVPLSEVQAVRDRLFGSRSTFALLPVGMGLEATERTALQAGLLRLRMIRAMPACVSGTVFEWPDVVFESPDEAGNAVAIALQDVTCTFTVAPQPTPLPSPGPTPGPAQNIQLTALDGRIELTWAPPAASVPIVDYRIRCQAGDGIWIESDEGVSPDTTASVDGLTNGASYTCEVAAVGVSSVGVWAASRTPATPVGRPAAVSDAAKPCGSSFDCNPMLPPILGILGVVLVGGLLAVIVALYRDRTRGYVVAVVDTVHTANLGHGSNLGIAFVRASGGRRVTGIVGERGSNAEIRIRLLRGDRFRVTDRAGRHVTSSGEPIITLDSVGVRHELVLRAFATKSASPVTSHQ